MNYIRYTFQIQCCYSFKYKNTKIKFKMFKIYEIINKKDHFDNLSYLS